MTLSEETIMTYKQFTDWTKTLLNLNASIWLKPISEGKVSIGEIISHLMNWDRYLISTIIPSVKNREGMVFPDFDSFNRPAYEYAKSGVSKDQLLNEFMNTRLKLSELLLSMSSEDLNRHITANGVSICPHTGKPYTLRYIIQEFNDHDGHHKKQILKVI